MSAFHQTGNGFVVEGVLLVFPEDDSALIQIDDTFFDDLLRRRFAQSSKDRAPGCVVVPCVRITVEMLEP